MGLLPGDSGIEWFGCPGLKFLVGYCRSRIDRRCSSRTMVYLTHLMAEGLVYMVCVSGVLCAG